MKARDLRRGDRIICPGRGTVERVDMVQRRPGGRLFLRTSAHDHFPRADAEIQLATEGEPT